MSVEDVGAAYDAIAATYELAVSGDEWIRRRLWQHYLRVFRPGHRVLDLSCGTGVDAVFLAERGIQVVGLDTSAGMIAECRRKITEGGLDHLVEAHQADLTELPTVVTGDFDGALSAFGGLNTVTELRQLSDDVARRLRPGAHFVVHAVNRFSLWEALAYLRRGQILAIWRLAGRNRRDFPIGDRLIRHQVYSPDETYTRFFAADFSLREAYGQGILRPPHKVERVPPFVADIAGDVERSIDSLPIIRGLGRFFVLDLERG
jgi:ubiquinone/menaquinone biosynthesis C-methylase UbiE